MATMWAYLWLASWMAVLGLAQTLIPTNWTATEAAATDNMTVTMQISIGGKMVPIAPVLALSEPAATSIPPTGISGALLLTNPSNALNLAYQDVSFISCDTYTGNIQASQVFGQAVQFNVAAVVLYSHYSDYCKLEDYEFAADESEEYLWVYTMKNITDTETLLNETSDPGNNGMYALITTNAQRSTNGTGPPGGASGSGANGGGPPPGTPSTAVAMVILYSITGVITALFLVIIITGAIRARRHPERYGPRNIVGRPRQSRARGLAIAMLETLPIVKFGEREEPKPADVELAEHSPERDHQTSPTTAAEQPRTADAKVEDTAEGRRSVEGGIAAAIGGDQANHDDANPDHLGCSICTEDFQAGEDQRVLPCDHRFHPACIDPWLLNVSGTCPLCRIDLRPQGEDTGEVDENGNPILREPGLDLELTVPEPPPQRMGVRRSIIEGIRGIGRPPQQMSREERIAALQQMRNEHLARIERQAATQNAEEERSTRQRLRRVFGVRTRRTETTEQNSAEASASAAPADESGGGPNT